METRNRTGNNSVLENSSESNMQNDLVTVDELLEEKNDVAKKAQN